MSSIYRLICLSHDPGLVLNTEWQSGLDGRRDAETALRQPDRSEHEEVRDHADCNLVIGRYSASLVEVGQLPYNTNVHWVDVEWLRVLAAAVLIHDKTGNQIPPMPHGWTADRVRRLAPHLNMEPIAPTVGIRGVPGIGAAVRRVRTRGTAMSDADNISVNLGNALPDVTTGTHDPARLLAALRLQPDQLITNHEGEQVYLKQVTAEESGLGHGYLIDCCWLDAPCERHKP